MAHRFLRFGSITLAIVFAAASTSSAGVTNAPQPLFRAGSVKHAARRARGVPHPVRIAGSHAFATVTFPTGCSSNGNLSFIGEPGSNSSNRAGGGSDGAGQSGVLAGDLNEACDGYSAIGAGAANIVGGDGTSEESTIVAGAGNGLQSAQDSFIGAGGFNTIGSAAPYNGSPESAIVSGANNTVGSPLSFIGAGDLNSIVATTSETNGQSAFIGAGYNNAVSGNFAGIVTGQYNSVAADNSAVVGGYSNVVGTSAGNAIIVGGYFNAAYGYLDTIVGGYSNTTTAEGAAVVGGSANSDQGYYSFIGAGTSNNIYTGGQSSGGSFSVISGGNGNVIQPSAPSGGEYAVIGGGYQNKISGELDTIAGGSSNTAAGTGASIGGGQKNSASATNASVTGGYKNIAGGTNATVMGGVANVANGADSFAAGTASNAAHSGAFVWSDNSTNPKYLSSTASNQFLARAAGGFYLYSSANLATGVRLSPGSGSWSTLSDRASKTGIQRVDAAQILTKVAALPVSEWSYTEQGTKIRHLGPMAQDFRAAFALGEDDRHISTVDEEGVALTAIKALAKQLTEKDRQLDDMRRIDDAKFTRLEERIEALAAELHATGVHATTDNGRTISAPPTASISGREQSEVRRGR